MARRGAYVAPSRDVNGPQRPPRDRGDFPRLVSALTARRCDAAYLLSVRTLACLPLTVAALLAAELSVRARSQQLEPVADPPTWAPEQGGDAEASLGEVPRPARFRPRPPTARIEALIVDAATLYSVSPGLVRAIVETESGFDPLAVSQAGATGLMQLTPGTAGRLGVTDCFDVRQNLFAGTRHLRELLDAYDGDLTLAIAAYNAGKTAVARYGGVPPYPETREYVRRVAALALAHDAVPASLDPKASEPVGLAEEGPEPGVTVAALSGTATAAAAFPASTSQLAIE